MKQKKALALLSVHDLTLTVKLTLSDAIATLRLNFQALNTLEVPVKKS